MRRLRYTWDGADGAVSRGFPGGAGGGLEVMEVMEEEVGERIEGGGLLMTRPCSGVPVPEDDGDDGDIVIVGEKEEKGEVEKEEGEKEEGEGDMGRLDGWVWGWLGWGVEGGRAG